MINRKTRQNEQKDERKAHKIFRQKREYFFKTKVEQMEIA
jgi:hypothetical protein